MAAHPEARPARVSEQHRSGYVVAEASKPRSRPSPCRNGRRRSFRKGEITESRPRSATGCCWKAKGRAIVALLPRHTAIKRGAAGEHYHQQVIAANVDTVFIVCGLDDDFNPRRIERYLMLVGGGGANRWWC